MPRRNESEPTVGSTDIALFKQTGMENSKSPNLPVQMATFLTQQRPSKTEPSFRVFIHG